MLPVRFILFLSLFCLSNAALAIRCQSQVVAKGDSIYKFYKLCGEPDFSDKRIIYHSNKVSFRDYETIGLRIKDFQPIQQVEISLEKQVATEIEEWLYDFGSNRLMQKITFIDGIAVDIESQGYGIEKNQ